MNRGPSQNIKQAISVERVLVVGGGIGGLTAATALARRGAAVDLVETNSVLSGLGVGLGLGSNALSALSDIGVDRACLKMGAHFDRLELYDEHEQPVTEHVFDRFILDYPPFCALPRSTLHSILADAAKSAGVNLALTESVCAAVDSGQNVRVSLMSGRSMGPYDLVLGFDGIRSKIRQVLFGDAYEPMYTGYGVWRATVPRPPSLISQRKYLGNGGRPGIGIMPISETTAYLSCVRPEPEGKWYKRDAFVERMRDALGGYPGDIAEIRALIKDADTVVFSPLEFVQTPLPWSRGRIAIAGDAAHASVPHLTQGAAMAIEDAIVLARNLVQERHVDRALTRFAKDRYPRTQFVQEQAMRVLKAEQSRSRLHRSSANLDQIAESFRGQLESADAVLNTDIFGNRAS